MVKNAASGSALERHARTPFAMASHTIAARARREIQIFSETVIWEPAAALADNMTDNRDPGGVKNP
jgi:hypothetical protein